MHTAIIQQTIVLGRTYKELSTATAGVVTFQLQQVLGSNTFGVNVAAYLVTMSLQSSDFGLPRGFWSGIIELSGFAGVRGGTFEIFI